ncbi:MAG: LptF/LptG family permease [Trueperaceae bacterium]|nr:LptF/LptG family permease [Trueperaceae bacterium]
MRRLDRALLAEGIPALVFGALLYGVLAVMSATLPRLQWLVGASVPELLAWLAAQLPTALAQTMPIALVLAVLLTFGRMAGDRELLAWRAGGVSLPRIVRPMLILGAVLTLGTLAIHQWVTPRTHAWVAGEYWRMTAGGSGLFRLAGRSLPVAGFTLHFGGVDRGSGTIEDVRIEQWQGERLTLLRAEQGRFDGGDLVLTGHRTQILDLAALDGAYADAAARLRALVPLDNRARDASSPLRIELGAQADDLAARFSQGGFEDPRSLSELAQDWQREGALVTERRTAGATFMRRLAEPFANLVLLLVAVPLSLGWARGRGVAFGLSLVVTLVWYLLLTVGQFAAQAGTVPVWAGPWSANVLLGAIGVALMMRLRTR